MMGSSRPSNQEPCDDRRLLVLMGILGRTTEDLTRDRDLVSKLVRAEGVAAERASQQAKCDEANRNYTETVESGQKQRAVLDMNERFAAAERDKALAALQEAIEAERDVLAWWGK